MEFVASGLLFAAAVGIIISGVFPTDPAGSSRTWPGFVHSAAVSASLVLNSLLSFCSRWRVDRGLFGSRSPGIA